MSKKLFGVVAVVAVLVCAGAGWLFTEIRRGVKPAADENPTGTPAGNNTPQKAQHYAGQPGTVPLPKFVQVPRSANDLPPLSDPGRRPGEPAETHRVRSNFGRMLEQFENAVELSPEKREELRRLYIDAQATFVAEEQAALRGPPKEMTSGIMAAHDRVHATVTEGLKRILTPEQEKIMRGGDGLPRDRFFFLYQAAGAIIAKPFDVDDATYQSAITKLAARN